MHLYCRMRDNIDASQLFEEPQDITASREKAEEMLMVISYKTFFMFLIANVGEELGEKRSDLDQ